MNTYEKKYKEALARAREIHISKDEMEYLFPELKESEDDRIRKDIIWCLKHAGIKDDSPINPHVTTITKDAIAWLEKQGDKDELIKELGEYKAKYTQEVLEKHLRVMNKDDERLRKTTISFLKDFADKGYENVVECIDWLEKQGEQKPAENKGMNLVEEEMTPFQKKVFCIIDTTIEEEQGLKQVCDELLTLASNEIKQKPTTEIKSAEESLGIDSETYNKIVDACIYGEQKPDDKVEPKFKVGDCLTDGTNIRKIIAVGTGLYVMERENGTEVSLSINYVERNYHKWTIQDAKDGDVLCYEDEFSIYKHDIKNCTKQETTFGGFVYHCCYDGKRFITDSLYSLTEQDKTDIHPANKEQRDLLFQKMKEEGYVWDAEKKQLRKMEHDKLKFQILKTAWYVCTCTTCTEDSRIWFNNGTAYLGSEILKYDLGFEPEEYQNYFRLWTIKDAKDGDILASKSGNKIFSYRGSLDLRGNPCAYYGIYKVHDGICFSPCAIGNSFTYEEVVPATKEQRKILFEERTAAGGVLHFSKKELKKIKDETEIPFGAKDSELQEATYYIPKGFHAEIDDDKVVVKKGEKPTGWSEEDNQYLCGLIGLIEQSKAEIPITLKGKAADNCIDWLKSLRPQNTWKPSDEQMDALEYHLKHTNENSRLYKETKKLYDQLKKLK